MNSENRNFGKISEQPDVAIIFLLDAIFSSLCDGGFNETIYAEYTKNWINASVERAQKVIESELDGCPNFLRLHMRSSCIAFYRAREDCVRLRTNEKGAPYVQHKA